MSVQLKSHNVVGYNAVKEKLKTSNRTALIRPTGTGKSFVALKLIEDNEGKKVIYLSSSKAILHQFKKNMVENEVKFNDGKSKLVERYTYQKLVSMLKNNELQLKADYVILDEFHHCGAPEWGLAIEKLLKQNPNAKILGLSATPIRYFDETIRDMADELFEGNIADEMNIAEAIEQGILKEPIYITGIYDVTKIIEEYEEKIDKCQNEGKKIVARQYLGKLESNLNVAVQGLPELLASNMSNSNGKYVVFCKNIEDMQNKMMEAQKIFGKVNPKLEIYSLSSKKYDKDGNKIEVTETENNRQLKNFEKSSEKDKLKLLFAVDMLSEGWHYDGLDGVIMMRPTSSPTLFAQQFGRALSIGGEKQPVIIDLVNNVDSIRVIENFNSNFGSSNKKTKSVLSGIKISSKMRDITDIINKIDLLVQRKSDLTNEEKLELMLEYMKSIEDTDEVFTVDSQYKGCNLGKMRSDLRLNYLNGKLEIDEELLKKFLDARIIIEKLSTQEIESIKTKYGISTRDAKKISKEYGNVDEFMEKFKRGEIDDYKFDGKKFVGSRELVISERDLTVRQKKAYVDFVKFIFEDDLKEIKGIKKIINVDVIDEQLELLNERDKNILRSFYGLNDGKAHTMKEVGDEFGRSGTIISRVAHLARSKIEYNMSHTNGFDKNIIMKERNIEEFDKLLQKEKMIDLYEQIFIKLNKKESKLDLNQEQKEALLNIIKFNRGLNEEECIKYLENDVSILSFQECVESELSFFYRHELEEHLQKKSDLIKSKEWNEKFMEAYRKLEVDYIKNEDIFNPDSIVKAKKINMDVKEPEIGKDDLNVEELSISILGKTLIRQTDFNLISEVFRTAKEGKEKFRGALTSIEGLSLNDINEIVDACCNSSKEIKTIEEFGFSVRTNNCLKNEKIDTLDDLLNLYDEESGWDNLKKISSFGARSFGEVYDALERIGLQNPEKTRDEKESNIEKFIRRLNETEKKENSETTEVQKLINSSILHYQEELNEKLELLSQYGIDLDDSDSKKFITSIEGLSVNEINAIAYECYNSKKIKLTEKFSFSVRTNNCLKHAKIDTLDDLLNLYDEESGWDNLRKLSSFGAKSFGEVYDALERIGLQNPEKTKDEKESNKKTFIRRINKATEYQEVISSILYHQEELKEKLELLSQYGIVLDDSDLEEFINSEAELHNNIFEDDLPGGDGR